MIITQIRNIRIYLDPTSGESNSIRIREILNSRSNCGKLNGESNCEAQYIPKSIRIYHENFPGSTKIHRRVSSRKSRKYPDNSISELSEIIIIGSLESPLPPYPPQTTGSSKSNKSEGSDLSESLRN